MFRCVLFVCFAEWILWLIVCQPQYYFVCVSGPVFVCVHVCGGQAVPMKWVTWPMHRVAEGFLSPSTFSPPTFLGLSTCLSLYLCADLCEMYTGAHVPVGSFRRRAGPAGEAIEEIPEAHMEPVSPVFTLSGILQLYELWGGTRSWVGKKR